MEKVYVYNVNNHKIIECITGKDLIECKSKFEERYGNDDDMAWSFFNNLNYGVI